MDGARKPDVRPFVEPTVRYPEPRHLRAADQVALDVDLPSIADPRQQRRWHRGVRTERAFARKVTVPPGGGTPIHAVTCDHVIVQLAGMAQFHMRGQIFELRPGDLLYFPANMLYAIRNVSAAEASLMSVGIEASFGWPPMSDYWAEPGTGAAR